MENPNYATGWKPVPRRRTPASRQRTLSQDEFDTCPTSLWPLRVPVGAGSLGFPARAWPDAAVVFALTEPGALVLGTGGGFVARDGRFIRPNLTYLASVFFRTALALGVEKENTYASGFFVGFLNLLAVAVGLASVALVRCAKTRLWRGLPALLGAGNGRFIRPNLPYLCLAGATLFFAGHLRRRTKNEERRTMKFKAEGSRPKAEIRGSCVPIFAPPLAACTMLAAVLGRGAPRERAAGNSQTSLVQES